MAPGKLGRRSPKAEATPRSRDEQIHKIRFVYTVKYYSALKREVFLFLFSILGFYWVFKISQVGLRGCLASESLRLLFLSPLSASFFRNGDAIQIFLVACS